MLKEILSVSGKPGLFKLVSQGNNSLIVESLVDGKRMPTYMRDKVISLGDIAMYTEEEDMPLGEIMTKVCEKEGAAVCSLDPKKATNAQLFDFFGEVVPNFDRDRVYPSDVKKLIQWYNILVAAGITTFEEAEEEATEEA